MNAYHFTSLHYTNSLGTDLHIGLNPDYKWLNAHETSLTRTSIYGKYA